MSVRSEQDNKKHTQGEARRAGQRDDKIARFTGAVVEISEDAYKQNDVYRPWRGRVA